MTKMTKKLFKHTRSTNWRVKWISVWRFASDGATEIFSPQTNLNYIQTECIIWLPSIVGIVWTCGLFICLFGINSRNARNQNTLICNVRWTTNVNLYFGIVFDSMCVKYLLTLIIFVLRTFPVRNIYTK